MTTWQPDPVRRVRAQRALVAPAPLAERLEEAGVLVAMGCADDVTHALLPVEDVHRALGIDEATLDSMTDALASGSEDDVLEARTRMELRCLGARTLAGAEPTSEQQALLGELDELLRAALWRLVGRNAWRGARLATIAPSLRARFFWLSEGVAIPEHAPLALPAVAELVARFPEAAAELERWIDIARGLRPTVRALWQRRDDDEPRLRLAAADAFAQRASVVEPEVCEVTFMPPDVIVVDVLAPLTAPPELVMDSERTIAAERVPEALDRFRFALGASVDEEGASLLVPLARGTVRVRL